MKIRLLSIIFGMYAIFATSQNVAFYQQFNGRYDFTMIGNTLNIGENNINTFCDIQTAAAASLSLSSNQIIEKAFLYWAGSGTGDFAVKLNGTDIVAQRTFLWVQNPSLLPYFSAFADVTNLVLNGGNGLYTLSDLDVNAALTGSQYCVNRTNFGGWALVIVYKDQALPLNQLNIYDGLQGIPPAVNITLNSLNVIDNAAAKIGFLAWEGDATLAVGESLKINGNVLSNALNPPTNAFNGTNSITGATDLYNMDIDIYDIQNNIAIGDSTASIELTSSQDFVMINVIVTKLNSQLPDATIAVNNIAKQCNSRIVIADYTVYNTIATNALPANVPISFFANGIFLAQTSTVAAIPIGGSQNGTVTLQIPTSVPDNFVLTAVVDSNNLGVGTIAEIIETNNNFAINVRLLKSPKFNVLQDLKSCNLGLSRGFFDFSDYKNEVKVNPLDVVQFFDSQENANLNTNEIFNDANYIASQTPKEIFVKITNADGCFAVTSFKLLTNNCPPKIYNAVSANEDNLNDFFFVDGLRNIFLNHHLYIYNRWGQLVWEGNNTTDDFRGFSNRGVRIAGNVLADGTYFYVLELNDVDFPSPYNGFLYLTR